MSQQQQQPFVESSLMNNNNYYYNPVNLWNQYVHYVNDTLYNPATIRTRECGFHVHVIINSFLLLLWLLFPLIKYTYMKLRGKKNETFNSENLAHNDTENSKKKKRKHQVMPLWRKLFNLFHICLCIAMLLAGIPYSKDPESHKWLCWWAYISTTVFFYLLIPGQLMAPKNTTVIGKFHRFCLKYLLYPISDIQSLANFGYWYMGLIHDRWDYIWAHYVPHAYLLVLILVNIAEYDDHGDANGGGGGGGGLNPFTQPLWYWILEFNIATPFVVIYYYVIDVHVEYRINMDASVRFAVLTKLNILFLFVFVAVARAIWERCSASSSNNNNNNNNNNNRLVAMNSKDNVESHGSEEATTTTTNSSTTRRRVLLPKRMALKYEKLKKKSGDTNGEGEELLTFQEFLQKCN